ncbi:MAG: HAMP domain-containing histidine kinase [Candidatus Symbiothrix sp.]|nr:HAMP domain-containing histidine kinase [Candidatus Symbiothrix sp.]
MILILVFQAYSLLSQYNYLSKIIATSYEESFNAAINIYRSYRFNQMSEGGSISIEISDLDSKKNATQTITIDELMYRMNGLLIISTPFEIQKLDSIYSAILQEKSIASNYNIVVFVHASDSILQQSQKNEYSQGMAYTSRKELDSERDIQVYLTNPALFVMKKMLLSFLFSFIMLIVIILLLMYQSKIIAKQKKIEIVRQNFTDRMTHELRHPLQGALSLSEILENKEFAENHQLRNNVIGRLKTNLKDLDALLNSLVVQSYSENLQSTANWQQGNLKNFIDEIIAVCSISNTKLIHFTTFYSDEITHCWFDPMHFPNAIKNLIENSVKYSNDEVTIKIEAHIENEMLKVSVSDNGIGIKKEDMPHIFQKFFRGNKDKSTNGFGLGLSYVKWVCEIHDGQVSMTSQEDEGSVFTLTIPLFDNI